MENILKNHQILFSLLYNSYSIHILAIGFELTFDRFFFLRKESIISVIQTDSISNHSTLSSIALRLWEWYSSTKSTPYRHFSLRRRHYHVTSKDPHSILGLSFLSTIKTRGLIRWIRTGSSFVFIELISADAIFFHTHGGKQKLKYIAQSFSMHGKVFISSHFRN